MEKEKVEFVGDVDIDTLPIVKQEYNKAIVCKCKPTYNYRSIEFEYVLTPENRGDMYRLYKDFLFFLQATAPEQDTKGRAPKKSKVKEKLATEKQREVMKKYFIPFDDETTLKEAQEKIQQALDVKKRHPGCVAVHVFNYDDEFNAYVDELDCVIPNGEYEVDPGDENFFTIYIPIERYKELKEDLPED